VPVPILATKLYLPPLRPGIVPRTRLVERLNEGLAAGRKLALISASAGFGKTTLVSEWISALTAEHPAGIRPAWLSLEEGDHDLPRFLTYLIAALQTAIPEIGAGGLIALQSPQSPPVESILTGLLNEVATVAGPVVLVLDDYHALDAGAPGASKPVDDALAFLIAHQPPHMHLVIASREDPSLPLARLRARGQLIELRAADLRFSAGEAAEFLNRVMKLNLAEGDVAALEARTEGWIAGLQMAALSMQGRPDAAGFIQSFTGSHRFVLDYLLEEVLERQPGEVQTFLLRTSILERLCGPLCEALLEESSPGSGQRTLEALERANLFLVALDNERRWYRYHHLFADLLRQRLGKPQELSGYHLRASAWFEANAYLPEAIAHALAAGDYERAARLAEIAWPETFHTYRQNTLFLGWMKALPDEVIHARPVLCVGYAWALQDIGKFEDAWRWLDLAENPPGAAVRFVDEVEYQALPANIALARGYVGMALGDAAAAEQHARRALALLPEADLFRRAGATAVVGMVCLQNGELEAAASAITEGMEMAERAGSLPIALSGAFPLVDIRLVQGRLREALSLFEHLLQKAAAAGAAVTPGTPDLYLGLCGLLLEQGELERARQMLQKSDELGEAAGLPDWRYRTCLTRARYLEALGDLEGAFEQICQAERLYQPSMLPELHSPGALKARLRIKQGRPEEALAWARTHDLTTQVEPEFFHEFEHITLARALGAAEQLEVLPFLERLLQAAQTGGRMGSAIEILILLALACKKQGDMPRAFACIEQALTLAEPQGYLNLFVAEGDALSALLVDYRCAHKKQAAGSSSGYLDKILAAFSPPEEVVSQRTSTKLAPEMVEALTARELEILRLIAAGQSNAEIGRRLYLALSTVKGHNLRIFDKLQVQNRTEAVARARELGLL